ncbi:helix-turn-helix domain-containing protein [Paraburkholderia sp. Ac-20342]|uniref:transcriptional regulator n=1 Tax=Paraburkholderia sp. Ac-20342 TaxID=2703889 RepID=UPI00197F76D2|nr:Cro/CI family transcriptional regulator [Paraburkholderia sp. Ac-20342]MBN3848172.1 helix-turn-helix domain-containing protein [Paraburkholderia sp. Ac-20342]
MTKEHIEKAILIAGSQASLAKAIGVTQQTISNWKEGGAIRPEYCSRIERFTDGAVTRQDLRPDDWREIWPELEAILPRPLAA